MADTVGTPNKRLANKEISHYLTRSLETDGISNIPLLDPKFPQKIEILYLFHCKTISVD